MRSKKTHGTTPLFRLFLVDIIPVKVPDVVGYEITIRMDAIKSGFLTECSHQICLEFGKGFEERKLNKHECILPCTSNLDRIAYRIEVDPI